MKAIFCGINSKYIHTNLAIRYLYAYSNAHSHGIEAKIFEDTVNSPVEHVASALLEKRPDILLFSTYIWNVEYIKELCHIIRKSAPHIIIILGGPEVSYNWDPYISCHLADYVQRGEGEKAISRLLTSLADGASIPADMGICYLDGEELISAEPYFEKDLNTLENPYTDEYMSSVNGRLAYFEASRGCPFSCGFCLSGGQGGVRNFDMDYVKKSILTLWDSGAKTVKFVDRTFNANRARADEIISFIIDNAPCKPRVCFHFEIAADILADSTISLLAKAPKGLFQIEAGLQSFNPDTLSAVKRTNSTDKVCDRVRDILALGNIHTHIDLIAGLPHEDFESFRNSFNMAYNLGADMLQLGFLKLLHGSRLRAECATYGIEFEDKAPYTVKRTSCLTPEDISKLYDVEDANEKICSSHRFDDTFAYVLEVTGNTPFDILLGFGRKSPMPLDDYTDLLFEYFSSLDGVDKAILRDKMCIDRLRTNNTGILPSSLRVFDDALKTVSSKLDGTPCIKGGKRAICILYTMGKVVYADYAKGDEPPYTLHFSDI